MSQRYPLILIFLTLAAAAIAQPDLLFSDAEITGADRFPNLGQTRTLEFRYRNDGDAVAEDVAVGLYLSRDATFSSDDCFVEEFADLGRFIPTDPRISGSLSGRVVQFPIENYVGGDYFIIAVIDYLGANDELNEDNNTVALATKLRGTAAEDVCNDLPGTGPPVSEVSVSAVLDPDDRVSSPGGRVSVDYVVRNTGSTNIDDLPVGFYLSLDADFDEADVFLEAEGVNVDAGESEPEFEQVSLPEVVAPGDYFFLVVLDFNDDLREIDETNNVAALPIEIPGAGPSTPAGPDLAISSATAVAAGADRVTVDFTVANVGDASAGASFVVFYTSSDAERGGDDRYFAYARLGELGPGEARGIRGTVPTGVSRSGDYYVIAVTDFTNAVLETDESNNVAAAFTGGGSVGLSPRGRREPTAADAPTVDLREAGEHVGGLSVSPNPAAATVELRFARFPGAVAAVRITDASGRDVLRREFPAEEFGESAAVLDLSELSGGVYAVSVVQGDRVATERLVIRR